MKSTIISYLLFLFVVLAIIFSINYLNKVCSQFISMDNEIEECISKEDYKKGYELSMKFVDEWQKKGEILSIFVDHKEMDNINNELYRLTQYLKSRNNDESLASTYTLRFFLKHIMNMEKINIQNIF